MPSDFEGDVASPLSRFCPRTRLCTILLVSVIMIQVGLSFSVLEWQKNGQGKIAPWWPLVPLLLMVPALFFARCAYMAEFATEQRGAILALLRTLLFLDLIVLTFYCSLQWLR